jgi:DNA-binding response OmpR family regulator
MIMLLTYRADLRDHLTTALRDKGYDVCFAGHRENVQQVIDECRPTILILDLYMRIHPAWRCFEPYGQGDIEGK